MAAKSANCESATLLFLAVAANGRFDGPHRSMLGIGQRQEWAVLTQCRCGHEARRPGTCIGPHRLMMMWFSGAQAFDNGSLFPRHADGWIPSGFRGE